MAEKIRVLGMDISLNHGAIIELTNGELTNFWYYTDKAGSAAKSQKGYRVDPSIFKIKDKHVLGVRRLAWIKEFLRVEVLNSSKPDFVGIEDYAIRAEQGAHYLGEVGGLARMLCWDCGVRFRLHDPTSVKMFVAHDGTCQKDAVQRAVEKRWDKDFMCFDVPAPKPTKRNPSPKQNHQTSEDLADAFGIAMMVFGEVLLRKGLITLSSMHEKEVRVYNRVTKTYPVSLLDREWICKN